MELIRTISLTVTSIVKLLWKRLPYIALYTGCLAVIYLVATFAYTQIDKQNVAAAPVDNYLKYTAFTVNNIREGEDLSYTVCRDFKGNYSSTGRRTVYIIPQGGTTKDRKFLYNKDYSGSIEGEPCQTYLVRDSTYHLKPGKYQLTLSGDITVQYGETKHYNVASQPFSVYAQPSGSADYQIQINNLSTEIEDLKRRLGIPVSESVVDSQPQTPAATAVSPAVSPSAKPSSSPTPSPAPAATPRTCTLGLLSLCVLGGQ